MIPFISHLQSIAVEAAPFTGLASDMNIRQKVHLDFDNPVPATGLSSASFYIKAESPRLVSSHLCFRQHGKKLPDRGKNTGIGGGI